MSFELQGHRGARGLKPENTLPSIEAALDAGVSSIEIDVHLTCDGVPVVCHDPFLAQVLAEGTCGQPLPQERWISRLTLAECRRIRVDRNPDPRRFAQQDSLQTPAAALFANARNLDPYGVPALADFLAFAAAYAGSIGAQAGKTAAQRTRAAAVRFDLELKRVPFEPHCIGDGFDGAEPALLERRVIEEVQRTGVWQRTIIRSFDHRCVRAVKQLEPRVTTAVLIADTLPVAPESLARDAGATMYCPDYRFVDAALIGRLHEAGLRVIPWTVNRPEDWERLIAWKADGLTTDYPDRMAEWLNERGIAIL